MRIHLTTAALICAFATTACGHWEDNNRRHGEGMASTSRTYAYVDQKTGYTVNTTTKPNTAHPYMPVPAKAAYNCTPWEGQQGMC